MLFFFRGFRSCTLSFLCVMDCSFDNTIYLLWYQWLKNIVFRFDTLCAIHFHIHSFTTHTRYHERDPKPFRWCLLYLSGCLYLYFIYIEVQQHQQHQLITSKYDRKGTEILKEATDWNMHGLRATYPNKSSESEHCNYNNNKRRNARQNRVITRSG